jgi:hypothetical protein
MTTFSSDMEWPIAFLSSSYIELFILDIDAMPLGRILDPPQSPLFNFIDKKNQENIFTVTYLIFCLTVDL